MIGSGLSLPPNSKFGDSTSRQGRAGIQLTGFPTNRALTRYRADVVTRGYAVPGRPLSDILSRCLFLIGYTEFRYAA